MTLMGYQASIAKATGVSDVAQIRRIEDCMRNDIVHSTLDWLSARQFNKAARDAKELLDYMDSPEGKSYMAQLAA